MKVIGAVGVSLLMAICTITVAASELWDSFLAQMGSYESTVAIAHKFELFLGHEDREGVGDLAEEVAQSHHPVHLALVRHGYDLNAEPGESDADYGERLAAGVADLGIFEDVRATRAAFESIGACETAGILLRNLILKVADGTAKPHLREGYIVLEGTSNDRRYAEALYRCQIDEGNALTPSALGYSHRACQAARLSYCPDLVDD